MQINSNKSKLTQKQKSQRLGWSVSTIEICRDQINMCRPCIKKNTKGRNIKPQKSPLNITQINSGKCDIESIIFSGTELNDKAFHKD